MKTKIKNITIKAKIQEASATFESKLFKKTLPGDL